MQLRQIISYTTALILALCYSIPASAQLSLIIDALPSNTPPNANLYIGANINNWNPSAAAYQFTPQANGTYQLHIANITPGYTLQYKVTRGSWASVEGSEQGNFIADRTYTYTGGNAIHNIQIAGWEDMGSTGNSSTANQQVELLHQNFYMPQLDRHRQIDIYLPPNYYTHPQKSYPVLYMHDGQNLFDAQTSFAGEWQIDESLTQLFNEQQDTTSIIIVGIHNSGAERLNEYSPWYSSQYNAGGQGDVYVQFIINTLKPFVDEHYRTLPDRLNTGIMGSSMGGLISLYAALTYPTVFGKAGVLSPSLWFANEVWQLPANFTQADTLPMRIYLLAGHLESQTMLPNVQNMYNQLLSAGLNTSQVHLSTHADGQHSEWYWAREFPAAYQWLFSDTPTSTALPPKPLQNSLAYPNPAQNWLQITLPSSLAQAKVQLYNSIGQLSLTDTIHTNQAINIAHLPTGIYQLKLYKTEQPQALISSQSIAIIR